MNAYKYHILHNQDSNTATTTTTYTSDRNITLVWVDEEAMLEFFVPNSRADHTIHMLKETNGDNYKLYNSVDKFLGEVEQLCKVLDLIVIMSGTFAEVIIPKLTESSLIKEIVSIVIFCTSSHREKHKRLLQNRKVTEICTNQSSLKAAIENEKHTSSTFVICDRHLKSLFHLEKELKVYSWYKKYMEILMDNYQSENKREKMLTLCTTWYETNGIERAEIKNFNDTYEPENAAKWYTKDCFLYRVVNQALRTLDMETINAFRFYIKDLSQQLEELYNLQKRDRTNDSVTVYRGYANMTTLELDKIQQNIGGLISFNGFTSTTKDFEIALAFATSKPTHESVIFQILANYNLSNVIFADITQYSEFHENEILFGLCSVFRITNFNRNENKRVSIVEMSATDEDAQNFEKYVQKEAEVAIEHNNNLLLRCINRHSRCRRIILRSTIIFLIIISVAAVILSRYITSKHEISSLNNCESTNCTTVSTSIDESTVRHDIASTNIVTVRAEAAAKTLVSRKATSTSTTIRSNSFSLSIPVNGICANATWGRNGTTVVGGNGKGINLNQIYATNFYIDQNDAIYVSDFWNYRVLKWNKGASNGVLIAGGNGPGNASNQFYPLGLVVDKDGTMLICDERNNRLQRWLPRALDGQTVISGLACSYLMYDDKGSLYATESLKRRVLKWSLGAIEGNGTIVTTGRLNFPHGLFVDRDRSIYVTEWNSHTVIKWPVGATVGIIVAGGNGEGSHLNQLKNPGAVIVDQSDAVYIVDTSNNRVVKWPKGATSGTLVVGDINSGSQADQLWFPSDLLFDRYGDLLVLDFFNYRIQKFTINKTLCDATRPTTTTSIGSE